ncbi:uncharacterized protein LOC123242045 [Gracilinanus agilis]|uniref:uncharacterized protein LOC123242045 n=1 Tax=Gracilinanus agilis TaxID=191870 RepID=UPI001CFF0FEE|nr:uncharacterized protein LOC123242045 [Gracilinanus agilis]
MHSKPGRGQEASSPAPGVHVKFIPRLSSLAASCLFLPVGSRLAAVLNPAWDLRICSRNYTIGRKAGVPLAGYCFLSNRERKSVSDILGSLEDTSSGTGSGEESSESSSETESESEESQLEAGKSSEEQAESSAEESSFSQGEDLRKAQFQGPFPSFDVPPAHCEHCISENKQNEQVMPRLLSRGQYLLKVDSEGTYQCARTGLIFEVNNKTDIRYSVLSWSKYANLVVKPWIVGGPLFDVKCDPAVLGSIQFPHTLCLGYHDSLMTFKVFHITKSGPSLESIVDHSTTHVKWHVSSLSPVGPVIQAQEAVQHHGVVILYKVIDSHPSLSFRVYVATNNDSFIKVRPRRMPSRVPSARSPCIGGSFQTGPYQAREDVGSSSICHRSRVSEPTIERSVDGRLLLDSTVVLFGAVWLTGDWIQHDQNQNIQRNSTNSNRRRKKSDSSPEEEYQAKRAKYTGSPEPADQEKVLSEMQLMTLARKLGKEWIQLAVGNLGLEIADIDTIQEKCEDITVCKFRMLKKWQEKVANNGTAKNLYNRLESDASIEVRETLKGFLEQM